MTRLAAPRTPRHLRVYRVPDVPRKRGRPKLDGPAHLRRMSDEDRQKLVKMPTLTFLSPNHEADK
jgi:hypothetical protein